MEIITRAHALASGLKRYFTGEPCRNGHIAERIVRDRDCVECARIRSRDKSRNPEVREKRREYFRKWQKAYRTKHPERHRASKLKPGHEALAAYKRKQRAKDPERHKAALRRSFQKHKAKRTAEMRAWKANNKEANSRLDRAYKARRRARKLSAEGSYSREDIEKMLTEQEFICAACPSDISKNYQIDHIHPLSRGGSNWPINLQLLCPTCNQSKGNKTMEEWLTWKAALVQQSALPEPACGQNDGRGFASAARLPACRKSAGPFRTFRTG